MLQLLPVQKLTVFISVTKDPHVFNAEEYLCPLYIRSWLPNTFDLLNLPTCTRQSAYWESMSLQTEDPALLFIPMETTEDVEDCKMYEIALYSGQRTSLPE